MFLIISNLQRGPDNEEKITKHAEEVIKTQHQRRAGARVNGTKQRELKLRTRTPQATHERE